MVPTSYELRDAPEYGEKAVVCAAPRTVFRRTAGNLFVCNMDRPGEGDDFLVVDSVTEAVLNEQYPGLVAAVRRKLNQPSVDTVALAS